MAEGAGEAPGSVRRSLGYGQEARFRPGAVTPELFPSVKQELFPHDSQHWASSQSKEKC